MSVARHPRPKELEGVPVEEIMKKYVGRFSEKRGDWAAFEEKRNAGGRRLVLLSTRAATVYTRFIFEKGDTLLFGRESAGVPDHVHESADARLLIPMKNGARSLNVAVSAAMVAGEAIRQIG